MSDFRFQKNINHSGNLNIRFDIGSVYSRVRFGFGDNRKLEIKPLCNRLSVLDRVMDIKFGYSVLDGISKPLDSFSGTIL